MFDAGPSSVAGTLCSAFALPKLPLTIALGGGDLVRDRGQSCGLQVALAWEAQGRLEPDLEVLVSVVLPLLDSSSRSPASRSPMRSGARVGCGELADEVEVGIPPGRNSPLTWDGFFSEFESPSHSRAFAVDFVDPGEVKVLQQGLSSGENGLLWKAQDERGEDQAYQGERMDLAGRLMGRNRS